MEHLVSSKRRDSEYYQETLVSVQLFSAEEHPETAVKALKRYFLTEL